MNNGIFASGTPVPCEPTGKPSSLVGAVVDCVDANSGSNAGSAGDMVKTISGILIWAVGLIAVIMIIIGGIKIVTSAGDAGKVKSGRSTIMYAVIGLVLALLAYAIVDFVMSNILDS